MAIYNGTSNDNYLVGTDNDDEIYGLEGNDSLLGGLGNDIIEGGIGDDWIEGGLGDDTLTGGSGYNRLFGGDGLDTVSYANETNGVGVILGDTSSYGYLYDTLDTSGNVIGIDNIQDIENVTGGAGNDYIIGNSLGNVISGGAGTDNLHGGTGDDIINGDAGNDYILGEDGADTLNGGTGDDYLNGGIGNDIIDGGIGVDFIEGGLGNDILMGGDGYDRIYGGDGIDTVSYANDTNMVQVNLALAGGIGGDGVYDAFPGEDRRVCDIENVIGGSGNDWIQGSTGNNVLSGGDGNDNIGGNDGDDVLNGGLRVDRLRGEDGNDTLNGDEGNDELYGGLGDDTVNGGAGNDIIVGDLGADTLDGGDGIDTLLYSGSAAGVTAYLDGTVGDGRKGDSFGDTAINIENMVGSAFDDLLYGSIDNNKIFAGAGNDLISGGAGDDYLKGEDGIDTINAGDGNDNLFGGTGDDILDGGDGNDWLEGGAGADNMEGGLGNDAVSYRGSPVGVSVSLNGGIGVGGDAEGDVILNVERLFGSDYSDILYGNDLVNHIEGFDGDDVIEAGDGADRIIGGTGTDTLAYTTSDSGVTVFLDYTDGLGLGYATGWRDGGDGGHGAGDIISNMENLTGSDFNDFLAGDDNVNVVLGGTGDDWIRGGAGGDTLDGGVGTADALLYDNSDAGVIAHISGGNNTGGHAEGDVNSNFEIMFGSVYNDTLHGTANGELIAGNAGWDYIYTYEGNDTLHGGWGNDRLYGGIGNDIMYGEYDMDVLDGGDGDDILYGDLGTGAGDNWRDADNLYGGAGNDILYGEAGIDYLYGEDGDDFLYGGDFDDDVLEGGNGIDYLDGGAGFDYLHGGAGDDTFNDALGDNYLYGDAGSDLFIAYSGAEYIYGEDTYNTGAAIDSDTVTYENSTAGVNIHLNTNQGIVPEPDEVYTMSSGGYAEGDFVVDIENITGSDYDDTFTLNASANTIDGRNGMDSISYSSSTAGVNVSLLYNTASGGYAEGDTISSIESVIGSDYDDVLEGTATDNVIIAGAGNDKVIARGGADTLDGGDGIDTLDYLGSNGAVTVDLITQTASGGFAEGNIISSFENVMGGNYGDTLTGDANDNYINGRGGSDTINAGAGDDYIIALGSYNTVDGGDGIDTIDYSNASSSYGNGISIYLDGTASSTSTAYSADSRGDIILNVEIAIGTPYKDTIRALNSSLNHTIYGGSGNDQLFGGYGNDVIYGEDGNDDLRSRGGQNTVYGGSGDDYIWTDGNGDDYIDGGSGNDEIIADGGNDTIYGGDGNDEIIGSAGADIIDGGTGIDTVDYSGSSISITVSLLDGTASGGIAEGDTISNVENIIGSLGNDNLTGDDNDNLLNGNEGVDIIHGGNGNDNIIGANGHDSLYGDFGNDIISGGDGDDWIEGGTGDDTISGGIGDNWMDGGVGIDTISYSHSTVGLNISLLDNSATYEGMPLGDTFVNFEGIIATDKDDIVTGDDGDNYIDASGGDDWVIGGAGADILNGGIGSDTLSYTTSSVAISVNLLAGTGSGGDAEGDTISNFENIEGTAYNDYFIGNASNNTIYGGDGDDYIDGGDGQDWINGGAGADVLIGGNSNDYLSYAGSAGGVTVDLATQTVSGGDAEGDTISSFEFAEGSDYNDSFIGSDGNNFIYAGDGDDNINSGDGFDIIEGGAGVDTIDGGLGNDYIEGGAGADILIGGDGFDELRYIDSSEGVTIDLINGTGTGGDAEGDTISGFEKIIGSDHDDFFVASALSDNINGGAGSDTVSYAFSNKAITTNLSNVFSGGYAEGDILTNIENVIGSDGDDNITGHFQNNTFEGGAGADTMDGGTGSDTLSYVSSDAAVSVDLGTQTATGGHATGDVFSNFENILGSAYNDILTGSAYDNIIEGGAGADIIDGGAGTDTLSYASSSLAVSVDLAAQTATGGDAAGDVVSGIENMLGSKYDDILYGDAQDNTIDGGAGNDTLGGGDGTNVLRGGDGDDIFMVYSIDGTYTHTYYGGNETEDTSGSDTISFENITDPNGVRYLLDSLATIPYTAGNNIAFGVENIIGTAYNDHLYGDSGNNTIYGGAGDDYIRGGSGGDNILDGGDGNDSIFSYTGADVLIGGNGFDTLSYYNSNGAITIDLTTGSGSGGYADGDIVSGFEKIIGSGHGDLLIGDSSDNIIDGYYGDDTINGGDGNDWILGNTGADVLNGGNGIDTVSYAGTNGGVAVTVDLITQTVNGGYADGDIISGFENVEGSYYDDFFIASADANFINGGGYEAGNELSNCGLDTVSYEASTSAIIVNLHTQTVSGGYAEGDTIFSIDNIIGTDYNDVIYGGDANGLVDNRYNIIDGGAGDDYINGGGSADTLTGGLGNDIFAYNHMDSTPMNSDYDTITDFTQGEDILQFDTLYFQDFSYFLFDTSSGTETVINHSLLNDPFMGFEIHLDGVYTLTSADFSFV